jgi:myosin heavy subunit
MAETVVITGEQKGKAIIAERLGNFTGLRTEYAAALQERVLLADSGELLATLAGQAIPPQETLLKQLQIQMAGRDNGEPRNIPPEQKGRFDELKARVQLLCDIRVADSDQLQKILSDQKRGPQLMREIEAVIAQDPDIQREFNGLSHEYKKKWIISLLGSNEIKIAINQALNEVSATENIVRDGVEAASAVAITAKEEMDEAGKRLKDIRKRSKEIDAELAGFGTTIDPKNKTVEEGPYLSELQQAIATIHRLDGETGMIAQMVKQLSIMDNELFELQEKLTTLMASEAMRDPDSQKRYAAGIQVGSLQGRISAVQAKREKVLAEYTTKHSELATARAKKAELEAKRQALQDEKERLPQQIKEAETEFRSKQISYYDALTKQSEALERRSQRLIALEKKLMGAIESGATETIKNDVRRIAPKLLAAEEKRIADEAEQARTEEKKAEADIRSAMLAHYRDGFDKVNWKNFRSDWKVLLNPAMNLEERVRDFIKNKPDLLKRFDGNAEFRKKIVEEYKEMMMKLRGIEPGGNVLWGRTRPRPIKEDEGRQIIAALGSEYLDNLVESNKTVKEKLKQLRAAGLIGGGFMGGRFTDALKKMPWSMVGIVLAVIVGAVGLGALAGV